MNWKIVGLIIALVFLSVMLSIFIRYIRTGGLSMVSCEGKGENFRCQNAPCGEGAKEVPFDCGKDKNQICCHNSEGYEDSGEDSGDNGDGDSGESQDESYATINLYGEQDGIGDIKGSLNVKAEEEKIVYVGITGKGINQGDKGCLIYLYDDAENKYLRIDDAPVRKYFKCSLSPLSSFPFTIPNSVADKDISLQVIAYKENCGEDDICQGVDRAGSYKVELEIEPLDNIKPEIKITSISDYWESFKEPKLDFFDTDGLGNREVFNPDIYYWDVVRGDNCPSDVKSYDYTSSVSTLFMGHDTAYESTGNYENNYLCVYVEDEAGNSNYGSYGPLKIASQCSSQDCGVIMEYPCYCGQGSDNKFISASTYYCAGLCKDYYSSKETCEFHLNGCS